MVCQICYEDPVAVVCQPCLHVVICTACADRTERAAKKSNSNLRCPICNVDTTFQAGQFRVQPGRNNNVPLMICELCQVNRIDIICLPCLHIKMCSVCARSVNEVQTPFICPFCLIEGINAHVYFPEGN